MCETLPASLNTKHGLFGIKIWLDRGDGETPHLIMDDNSAQKFVIMVGRFSMAP